MGRGGRGGEERRVCRGMEREKWRRGRKGSELWEGDT